MPQTCYCRHPWTHLLVFWGEVRSGARHLRLISASRGQVSGSSVGGRPAASFLPVCALALRIEDIVPGDFQWLHRRFQWALQTFGTQPDSLAIDWNVAGLFPVPDKHVSREPAGFVGVDLAGRCSPKRGSFVEGLLWEGLPRPAYAISHASCRLRSNAARPC